MEERVTQQNPFTSHSAAISANIIEQARIEMMTDFFHRQGGKVDVIAAPDYKPKPELDSKLRDQFERGRTNAHAKSVKEPSRKYIRTYSRKSPQVIINKKYIGTYPTIAEAVAARDQYLIDKNLPPAGD